MNPNNKHVFSRLVFKTLKFLMKNISLLFCILFFLACNGTEQSTPTDNKNVTKENNSPPKGKCKYSTPVAIFSDAHEEIVKHSFELKSGQQGTEIVEFKDGNILELYQSGCNEIRQEYRFAIRGNFKGKKDGFWFQEAINRLSYVGQLDEKYAAIGMWVGALEQMSEKMTIGQFTEAEPNTFIMVDRLAETESSLVIIVLERRV